MKIREIYAILNGISPFELQEKWDNCGLLIGSMEDEIEQVALSIDIDMEQIDSLSPKTLLITHHPLIFKPLKTLDFDLYPANIIKKMIQKEISLIAMHTNFDQTHLNAYVAKKVLGWENVRQDGLVCEVEVNRSFQEFLAEVTVRLGLENPKYTQMHETVRTVSLVTGSGMSFLPEIRTDCFLTGDIKFHDAMAAKSMGVSLIDIAHYESERHFAPCLMPYLVDSGIKAIIADSKNPFETTQEK